LGSSGNCPQVRWRRPPARPRNKSRAHCLIHLLAHAPTFVSYVLLARDPHARTRPVHLYTAYSICPTHPSAVSTPPTRRATHPPGGPPRLAAIMEVLRPRPPCPTAFPAPKAGVRHAVARAAPPRAPRSPLPALAVAGVPCASASRRGPAPRNRRTSSAIGPGSQSMAVPLFVDGWRRLGETRHRVPHPALAVPLSIASLRSPPLANHRPVLLSSPSSGATIRGMARDPSPRLASVNPLGRLDPRRSTV